MPLGTIAYFSMEIALENRIPTYSGGLGVLAGDTLRAAADLALPMVGVSLLHRQGYFVQRLDADGTQHEESVFSSRTAATFEPDRFTIGFARRATAYKRPGLLLANPARLHRLAAARGRLQVVFAGKAHPQDTEGKRLIQEVVSRGAQLAPDVTIVYLPEYDLELARQVVAGVELWLNTPKAPLEASGTSGMKAAHNGVPSLSVLDGWWLDGHVEGVTGWSIGRRDDPCEATDDDDAQHLYEALERTVLPLYTERPADWAEVMRLTIAMNASFFNAHRMLQEYVIHAYQDRNDAEPL